MSLKKISNDFTLNPGQKIECGYFGDLGTVYEAYKIPDNTLFFAHVLSKKNFPEEMKRYFYKQFEEAKRLNSNEILKMGDFVDSQKNFLFVIEASNVTTSENSTTKQAISLAEIRINDFTWDEKKSLILVISTAMRVCLKENFNHLGLNPLAVFKIKEKYKLIAWINPQKVRIDQKIDVATLDPRFKLFISPELSKLYEGKESQKNIDFEKCDVWSLSVLVFWIINDSEIPFDTCEELVKNVKKVIASHKNGKFCKDFLFKTLVLNPKERLTLKEALDELEKLLEVPSNTREEEKQKPAATLIPSTSREEEKQKPWNKPSLAASNQSEDETQNKKVLTTKEETQSKTVLNMLAKTIPEGSSSSTKSTKPLTPSSFPTEDVKKQPPREESSDLKKDNLSAVGQGKIKSPEKTSYTKPNAGVAQIIFQKPDKNDDQPKKRFIFANPEKIPYPPTKHGYELQLPRSEYIGNKSLIEKDFLQDEDPKLRQQKQTRLRNLYFLEYSAIEMLWGQCDELEEELDNPDFDARLIADIKNVILRTYIYIHMRLEFNLHHFCEGKNIFGLDNGTFEAYAKTEDFHCVSGIQFLHLYTDNKTFLNQKLKDTRFSNCDMLGNPMIKNILDGLDESYLYACNNILEFSEHPMVLKLREEAKSLEDKLRKTKVDKTNLSALAKQKLNRTILRTNICRHAGFLLHPNKDFTKLPPYLPGQMFDHSEIIMYWQYYKMLEEYELQQTEDHITSINYFNKYFENL